MKTKPLFNAEQIQERVSKLAEEINRSYTPETEVVCTCVANGAFIFYADLVRQLKCRVVFDVVVCCPVIAGAPPPAKLKW